MDRGLPGGKLSATDMRAAMGLWPEPVVGWFCCVVPAALASGGEPVRLVRGELELVPLALATDTGAGKEIRRHSVSIEQNEGLLYYLFYRLTKWYHNKNNFQPSV